MSQQPFAHQDASGAAGAPLAIFVNGQLVEHVNTTTDPHGDITARKAGSGAEALTVCLNHPDTAAVDCTICDPMEDSP